MIVKDLIEILQGLDLNAEIVPSEPGNFDNVLVDVGRPYANPDGTVSFDPEVLPPDEEDEDA